MVRRLGCMAMVLIIVAAAWYLYRSRSIEQRRAADEVTAEQNAARARLFALAKRNNAKLTWEETLEEHTGVLLELLTVDLERVWVTPDPIIFVGSVFDV